MPIQYQPSKYAFQNDEPSLTEQEHKDSCDINKMVRAAARGLQVRGSSAQLQYGVDDMNMDLATHLIRKQELESELKQTLSTQEFTQEQADQLAALVPSLKPKIKLRAKKTTTNDEQKPPAATPSTPTPPSINS